MASRPGATDGVCAGVSEDDLRQRRDWLEDAVRAGLPGAASAWLDEGAFGDPDALLTRPDDPLVIQWKQEAERRLRESAARGDERAMLDLAQIHDQADTPFGEDPATCLTWWTAYGEKRRLAHGWTAPGATIQKIMDDLSRRMTPAQAEAAIAEGRRIAARCCGGAGGH